MGCCTKAASDVNPEEEPYGPVGRRKCRDLLFLLLFILFWAGMIVVAVKAVEKGDPRR